MGVVPGSHPSRMVAPVAVQEHHSTSLAAAAAAAAFANSCSDDSVHG